MRIARCEKNEVVLQLVSIAPVPAPTLAVEELPVTGVTTPPGSFGGWLLKVLGVLFTASGGMAYWIHRRR